MSTIIQIKRSANVAAPSTTDLLEGELAYSYDKSNNGVGAKLYVEALDSGNNEVIHAIGGKYYTDAVDGATSNSTASTIVKRDALGSFSANVITAATLYGNIVGTITGVASSANKLETARDIGLSGDLTGNVSFDGTQNVTLVATIAANSVALGTDTTGDYVANVVPGTGLEGSNFGTEGATPTISLADTAVSSGRYGGTNQIPTFQVDAQGRLTSAANVALSTSITIAADTGTGDALNSGDTFRISGGSGIDTSVTDNTITVALETSGVTANTYGSASQIPIFTVDSFGRITSAANVDVTSSVTSVGGSTGAISNAMIAASLTGQNVSVGNLTATTSINASNIFQAGTNNVNITLGAEAGIIAITTAGNQTQFLPSGQINLGGTSTIAGGTFTGSGFTAGSSQTDLFQNRGGNVTVQVGTGGSISKTWVFGNDGNLYAPGDITTSGKLTGNLTYATGLPLSTGISGLGANQTTLLATNAQTGVSASTYGGATNIPVLTVDTYGRITSASNTSISTSFTVAGDSGTNQTVNGGDTLTIAGGTGLTSVGSSTDTITLNLDDTAVIPTTYGSATSVGSFTVDQQGRITSASSTSISIPSSAINTDIALGTQTSGAYVANLVAGTGITLSGLGDEGATPTITNAGVTSLTGTANEINVSSSTGDITLSLPTNVTIANNLTVSGNLVVTGNVTAQPVSTLVINDPLIQLANTNIIADVVDIGFYGSYNIYGAEPHQHTGLFRDASDGKYRLFQGLTEAPGTTVNISGNNYSIATLVANLTGGTVSGLSSNIAVSDGGTGRGTLTTNGVLFGQGTSAVSVATGTAYQVLQLNASGVPIFAGLDGGSY